VVIVGAVGGIGIEIGNVGDWLRTNGGGHC